MRGKRISKGGKTEDGAGTTKGDGGKTGCCQLPELLCQ